MDSEVLISYCIQSKWRDYTKFNSHEINLSMNVGISNTLFWYFVSNVLRVEGKRAKGNEEEEEEELLFHRKQLSKINHL